MRLRSEHLAGLVAAGVIGALMLSNHQLRVGADGARARLDREREQLAALARLQSRIDLNHRPDLEQLDELRGLFGAAEVRWTRRDGCAYLTFAEPHDGSSGEALAKEVAR
ncbi:MAG: hypothetical protein R3F29_12660 [Planctomycetota bacterium]